MATARLRLQAHVDGLLSGDFPVSLGWTLGAAVGQRQTLSLTAGADNTITVPTGTTVIVLAPPATNTQALTLKGNAGDTGIVLAPQTPTVLGYTSGTVIVNVGAGVTVAVEALFL